jgi:hypothetical protein
LRDVGLCDWLLRLWNHNFLFGCLVALPLLRLP